jgi:hypothetical protein
MADARAQKKAGSASRKPDTVFIVTDGVVTALRSLFWAGATIFVFKYIRDVAVAFAGHETNANLAFSFVTKFGADRGLAYLFGAGGVGYGVYQRNVRHRNIGRLASRSNELEARLDKNRSSSRLLPDGRTRPEDR